MNARRGAVSRPEPTARLKDIPSGLLVGLVVGVLGFVISFSSSTTSSVNGVQTSCSYTDVGALIAGAVCLLCAVGGTFQRFARPMENPSKPWLVITLAVVLLALAAVHALRGVGIIGGIC